MTPAQGFTKSGDSGTTSATDNIMCGKQILIMQQQSSRNEPSCPNDHGSQKAKGDMHIADNKTRVRPDASAGCGLCLGASADPSQL